MNPKCQLGTSITNTRALPELESDETICHEANPFVMRKIVSSYSKKIPSSPRMSAWKDHCELNGLAAAAEMRTHLWFPPYHSIFYTSHVYISTVDMYVYPDFWMYICMLEEIMFIS